MNTKKSKKIVQVDYNVGDVIDYRGTAMQVVEVTKKYLQLKATKAPYYSFPVELPLISDTEEDYKATEELYNATVAAQVLDTADAPDLMFREDSKFSL